MSLIFLSHSSANGACALALAQWLEENGWSKYFLDISENRGLVPGEQWQNALRNASHRCEAVVFVISQPWLDSKWCLAEFLLAKQLGKKIFGVLIDDIAIDELPVELTSEWQLCDLVHGEKRRSFDVERDPIVPATRIDVAETGLAALKRGLSSAGLEATTFVWPPDDDPERAPFRGLEPYTAADAAIFFGRDAAIVRGLDLVRQLRDHGLERMLVILGSSGAGKSSFMRAGLWPRLRRDDHHFYPLPVVRPGRAALNGPEGLVASVANALRDVGIENVSTGDIRARFKSDASGGALLHYLCVIRQALLAQATGDSPEPTFILPVDQCEELYASDVGPEADMLRSQLARLGSADTLPASATQCPRTLVLVTIRTDLYTHMQNDELFRNVGRQMIDLPPMDRSEYRHVIEGPARQASAAGRPLQIEAELTEQLLVDTEGADALPLLAFTLERLFKDYGADGQLTLAEYQALGGITGSLSASIEAAMELPQNPPMIPADPVERQRLLRQAFIPWLAEVDEQTGERRRRVARFSELPPATHAILQRLTQARLLRRDLRRSGRDQDEHEIIEVAHEALLRRWPTLVGWLDADEDALKRIGAVARAADGWEQNDRSAEFLIHAGERLRDASTLFAREDFVQRLGNTGMDYLNKCTAAEQGRVLKETRQQRFLRVALGASLVLAIVSTALYWKADDARQQAQSSATAALDAWRLADESAALAKANETRAMTLNQQLVAAVHSASEARATADVEREQSDRFLSLMHANLSQQRTEKGYAIQGALLALEALPDSLEHPERPYVVEAEIALYAALDALHTRDILRGHEDVVFTASFSPDGERIVTASNDGTARLWSSSSSRELAILDGHDGAVLDAGFSPDTRWLITGSAGGTARLWNAHNGEARAVLQGQNSPIYDVAFSPDGTLAATAARDHSVRIWKVASGCHAGGFRDSDAGINGVVFDSTGSRVLTTSDEGVPRVWQKPYTSGNSESHLQSAFDTPVDTSSELPCLEHRWIASATPYVADRAALRRGSAIRRPDMAAASPPVQSGGTSGTTSGENDGTLARASFSPDDRRILTVSTQGIARLWNADDLSAIEGFRHEHVSRAAFNPHDGDILLGFSDGRIELLDAVNGQVRLTMQADTNRLLDASFSADGRRIISRGTNDGARVWDATNGQELASLGGHWGQVLSAGFSPDGNRVVTAASDGQTRIHSVDGLLDSRVLKGHRSAVNSVAFSTDGRQLVSASADSTVRVWSLPRGRLLFQFEGHHNSVASAAFSPDTSLVISASDDGTAQVWHTLTGRVVAELDGAGYGFVDAAFDAAGKRVVTSSWDGIARVWSLADLLARHRASEADEQTSTPPLLTDETALRFDDGGAQVIHAAFSPDGNQLVTATIAANRACAGSEPNASDGVTTDDGRQIRIWNIDDGQEIQCLAGHTGAVLHAGFSSDGKRLASTSVDGSVRLWDADSGEQLLEIRRAKGHYNSVAFSDDGERLITTSDNAGVQLWDAASGKELDRLLVNATPASFTSRSDECKPDPCPVPMNDARFNKHGNRVAAASSDHDIHVWDVLSREALIRAARTQLPRAELTDSEKRRFFVASDR